MLWLFAETNRACAPSVSFLKTALSEQQRGVPCCQNMQNIKIYSQRQEKTEKVLLVWSLSSGLALGFQMTFVCLFLFSVVVLFSYVCQAAACSGFSVYRDCARCLLVLLLTQVPLYLQQVTFSPASILPESLEILYVIIVLQGWTALVSALRS